ncbi:MAG: hypothetical protein ACLUJR_01645 [Mediterraneibacter gnavus]
MEGYEKYASRIQELLFDGMDVHEVWVYMKVMFQIEKNEICFRAYLERSGLIWFAEAGSRRQVQVHGSAGDQEKTGNESNENFKAASVNIRIVSDVYIRIAHVMKALRKKGMMNWFGSWRSDREKRLMDEENTERKRRK